MATAVVKKIVKIGGSMALILPCAWTKGKMQPGDEVVVISNGELRIFPVHPKDEVKAQELLVKVADEE